ncbi:MAG: hypothetical protein J0H57_10030, partial [Rhodospirillales bacterium]|nr:hypothetical protein [Rhodospirillales bacterium]
EQKPSLRVIYFYIDSGRDNPPMVTAKDGSPLAKNPFKDARVRKAFSMAINRDAIRDRIMDGLSAPSSQFVPPPLRNNEPGFENTPFDPEGAKKLLAEAVLDTAALKGLLTKNGRARRQARGCPHLRSAMAMSERRACTLIAADRTMVRYRCRRPPEAELRARLHELANQRRRFGYRRLFILLRRKGALGHQSHLPDLPGGRSDGSQAQGPAAGGWKPHPDPGRSQGSTRAGRSTSSKTSSP